MRTHYLHINFTVYPPPYLMCKLFEALTIPILEYKWQMWDCQARRNNYMETLHRQLILIECGTFSDNSSIGVDGELRREPLQLRRKVLSIKCLLHLYLWGCYIQIQFNMVHIFP